MIPAIEGMPRTPIRGRNPEGENPSHTSKTNVSRGPSLVGAQNDSQTRAIRGPRRPELCEVSHRTSPARKVLFIYELSMMGEVSSVS